MEIVKVENLSKHYGENESLVKALDNINLSINKGEFICILGESGSGKSTLLNMLGALDMPTKGSVSIDGYNILNQSETELAIFRRQKIGFIFQFFNLIPVLNVEENITLPTLLDEKKIDKAYLEDLLKTLGLSLRRNHLPSELSGGQKQRVAIARALCNKPSIILADEPTGNLDSKNSLEVIDLLKLSIKKYNQTLIMITHNLEIARKADRTITISDGQIISHGGDK